MPPLSPLVAVMAASMSTADSNLHALSAVVTRDLYHPLRPGSSEKERAWVGRAVIVLATVVAAGLTYWGAQGTLLKTITTFFFMAMAFSAQLLPLTIDILFLKKGTRQGAIAGLAAGTLTVFLFPPLGSLILGDDHLVTLLTADLKTLFDVGFCGISKWSSNTRVRRVSSARTQSTSRSTRRERNVTSSRLPIGVATI